MSVIFLQNDNLIQLTNLRDLSLNVVDPKVYTATVTAQITDTDGNNIGSSIPMPNVSGTNHYEGVIPDDIAGLVENTEYIIQVTADDGADRRGFWELCIPAVRRIAEDQFENSQ